jgi:hypothetical protein
MLMRVLNEWLGSPEDDVVPGQEKAGRRRRGLTAMEYLVAISFILIALIFAVQHLGLVTGRLLGNSAKATNFTRSTGS